MSGHATNTGVVNEQTQDRDPAQTASRSGPVPPGGTSGNTGTDTTKGPAPVAAQDVGHATGGYGSAPVIATDVSKDKAGEVTGYKDSVPRADYFQTAKMANDRDMASANHVPTNIMGQEGAIPKMMEAQKKAREGGSNPKYQALRSKFEHEVGLLAAESPQALGAMKTMCDKSMDMMKIFGKSAGDLAGDPSTGYGGAVGIGNGVEGTSNKLGPDGKPLPLSQEEKDANQTVMGPIMEGKGNIREMAMGLQNMQTMIAKQLADPDKMKAMKEEIKRRQAEEELKAAEEAKAGKPEAAPGTDPSKAADPAKAAEQKAATMSSAELQAMVDRFEQAQKEKAKNMFMPSKAEQQQPTAETPGGKHAQFQEAKQEDHDTKLPPMPKDETERQLALNTVDNLTQRLKSLGAQKVSAQQAEQQAAAAVSAAQSRLSSAPAEGPDRISAQQHLDSTRAIHAGKKAEVPRIEGEIAKATSELHQAQAKIQQLDAKKAAGKEDTSKGKSGEQNPLAWSRVKVEEKPKTDGKGNPFHDENGQVITEHVAENGIKLSENEVEAMKRLQASGKQPPDTLPMMEGHKANVIDSSQPFITKANEQNMPLKSGISGTTMRFMEMAELMSIPPEDARLAMVGHLQPIEAHSIHEINTAASGFAKKDETGGGKSDISYDAKKANEGGGPYTEDKMKPLKSDQLDKCAVKAGFANVGEANSLEAWLAGSGKGSEASTESAPPPEASKSTATG